MSQYLGTLDITANTKTTFDAPNDGVKAILIGNESGLTVTITMESGGVQKTLYPSTVDWFPVKRGFSGKVLISPTVILNNVSSWPSSSLVFDAIGLNDPEDGGQYPVMLPRNTNIGNVVSTTGGTASAIRNDTSAPLQNLIEATPTDAASSTVSIDTSGNTTIKSDNSGVLTTLLQLVAGASPAVKLAASTIVTEVLGKLKVDSTLESVGAATMDTTLTVTGTSSLDNGAITTDGSGLFQLGKSGTAVNGSIGGTATFFAPLWGTSLKIGVIIFSSYNSANTLSFSLPSTMARGWLFVGNLGGSTTTMQFTVSSVGVNVRIVSTLGGTAAGATVTQSTVHQDSIASIISTVDAWTMTATGGATNGAVVFIGQ